MQVETTRPMRDLSIDEKREVLLDARFMTTKEVCEKYNITKGVFHHIKFFYGEKSTAKQRGYFHNDILKGTSDPRVEKIRKCRQQGMNSGEVAEKLRIPLEAVNKIWPTIKI